MVFVPERYEVVRLKIEEYIVEEQDAQDIKCSKTILENLITVSPAIES